MSPKIADPTANRGPSGNANRSARCASILLLLSIVSIRRPARYITPRGAESVERQARFELLLRTPHCSLLIASVRVAVAEDEDDRLGDDFEVEEEGPVLDVVEVVAGAFLDARIAAQPV